MLQLLGHQREALRRRQKAVASLEQQQVFDRAEGYLGPVELLDA